MTLFINTSWISEHKAKINYQLIPAYDFVLTPLFVHQRKYKYSRRKGKYSLLPSCWSWVILLVALIAIAIDLNVVCSVCGVGSVLLVVVVLFFLTKELDYRAKRGCPVPLEASPWLVHYSTYSYVGHNPQHPHNVHNMVDGGLHDAPLPAPPHTTVTQHAAWLLYVVAQGVRHNGGCMVYSFSW